jgi:para-nitrobenzyl esterase
MGEMRERSNWFTACAVTLALVSSSCAEDFHDVPAPTVTLASGELRGVRFSSEGNGIAFLGVRFAAPPKGELRWKPPQPVAR